MTFVAITILFIYFSFVAALYIGYIGLAISDLIHHRPVDWSELGWFMLTSLKWPAILIKCICHDRR